MSNLVHNAEQSNTQNDEQVQSAVDSAAGTPERDADNALPPVDEKTAKLLEQNESALNTIVALAVDTLDPKDMLKKYAKLGAAVLKHAKWQKSKFPAWAKEDFKRLCDKIADQVKFQVAITDVRMGVYVRVHLWVEAVKPLCADVEKLSYFQVANKFLPTLEFDPVDLTGEIKKGWLTWVRETVERQVGAESLSIKDLDKSYAAQVATIERERNAKKDPDKALEQERKALESKARKERSDAQSTIADSIDKAIVGDHVDPSDLMQIVEKVAKDHKITLPKVGADPATMTPEEAKVFAKAMWAAANISAMKVLRDQLDMMVKVFENAAVTKQVG